MIRKILHRLSAAVGRIFWPPPPGRLAVPPPVTETPPPPPPTQLPPVPEPEKITPIEKSVAANPPSRRPPRMWNIGLDFGTAFTKCVVRDLGATQAFVVPMAGEQSLLPSEVFVGRSRLGLFGETLSDGQTYRVQNLKMILAETASGQTDGLWATEFRRLSEHQPDAALASNPGGLTAYFLARAIQKAKAFILAKSPDFDESRGDRCFLNMAVPVAHAEQTTIAATFESCLRKAWLLAREASLSDWDQTRVQNTLARLDAGSEDDIPCYLYPEVSANVQSYIKSRAGADGLYLFLDVGAGTVDLSVFIYYTHPSNERPISYYSAGVIPLGSSQIEMRAARSIGGNSTASLESAGLSTGSAPLLHLQLQELLRLGKEGHKIDQSFRQAMRAAEKSVEDDLLDEAAKILNGARVKLVQDADGRRRPAGVDQWRTLNLLVGGGGARTPLYARTIERWFQVCNHPVPSRKPIPLPGDLKWPQNLSQQNGGEFTRFTVAYGLSFARPDLEDHRFPKEVRPVTGVIETPSNRPQAPSKDEC